MWHSGLRIWCCHCSSLDHCCGSVSIPGPGTSTGQKAGEGEGEHLKWFLENRERYYLQDYYDIEENKLVGRPLFSTQSLNYPLPLRTEEIHECAKNIIKIIHNRETLMNSNNRININENH